MQGVFFKEGKVSGDLEIELAVVLLTQYSPSVLRRFGSQEAAQT